MKKTKFSHRVIALTLFLIFSPSLVPVNFLLASNNGPNAPEASGFEPVDATDMVNLVSGDVSYVMPLLELDGFPVTLSYHAGIPLDMESSWAGLGWNVNTGAIARGVSGTPDDWKNGKSLDFIYFQDSEEFYNVNVGLGISNAASVGVGIAWGSNKSLSGSVNGSFMFANASIDTDGNYNAGIGYSASPSGQNYGAGISASVSGNVNGGASYGGLNIGVGGGTNSGAYASLGYSLTSGTASIGAGYSNKTSWDKGQAGGGSVSMGNYSAGDYDISSKGFYVPIELGVFNFGFGYRKVTYELDKGYPKFGFGSLYSGEAVNGLTNNNPTLYPNDFGDYQNKYNYSDLYEQAIPSSVEEFITDYKSEHEKVNFSFASYDNYSVNAPGISGQIQPKIFESGTLFGIGYKGTDTDDSNRKMQIYYHNGEVTHKSIGNNIIDPEIGINFYFNGQFTENVEIQNRDISNLNTNTFKKYLSDWTYEDTRQKSANYVEVFTNQQLAANNNMELIRPDGANYANYPQDGIGAYKITAPDGKTYHYAQPVYHFEQVERNLIKDNSQQNVNEKRQYSPFATHWLLTAITGPDYIDTNNDSKVDKDDYGYWVNMEYGKWSDGFVWRSPYKGKKYNTNLAGEIEEKDFGNYQYGRKQLYYLDKIVTREHTAYFVKDIRYDGTGAHGQNDYSTSNETSYNYTFNGTTSVQNDSGSGTDPIIVGESLAYKREYQLMLKKIIVVNNDSPAVGKNQNASLSLDKDSCFPGYNDDTTCMPGYDQFGGFAEVYGSGEVSRYDIHQEQSVYDVTDFANFDYSNSLKVIDLTYSYALARNTPSSIYCNGYGGGRLTLTGVYFKGKNNFNYMPPYRFDYKNEMDYPNELAFNKYYATDYLTGQAQDGWGYIDEYQVAEQVYNSTDYKRYGPDNWSLKEIKTPTGGKIKLEYEEDDYAQEAFSRKLWQDNLQFGILRQDGEDCGYFNNTGTIVDKGPCTYRVYVKNLEGIRDESIIDFNDYFKVGDSTVVDLWVGRSEDDNFDFSDEDTQTYFNLPGNYEASLTQTERDQLQPYPKAFDSNVIVEDILTDNTLVLRLNFHNFFYKFDLGFIPISNNINDILYYGKKNGVGSNIYESKPRGQHPDNLNGGGKHHTMSYKLLANHTPKEVVGGGIRAKSITVADDYGREYKTNYYYNKPGTPREVGDPNYKSSGITSYAPENGIKFVPYQSELPGPGVMYEYVTMVPVATNGAELGSTRYRFHTLDPIFNLFDPNLKMEYQSEKIDQNTGAVVSDNITVFESKVVDTGNGGYFDAANKTYAKTIDLKINTSLVGQFRSIETFNSEGHLMSKTNKLYDNAYLGADQDAKVIPGRGSVKESFQSMKSIFTTNNNDTNPVLKDRYVSISSKEDFSTVLNQVRTTSGGFTAIEKYSDADLETGAFRVTEYKRADGTLVRSRKVPAYSVYPNMGSKVNSISNKHMLVQQAMTLTEVEVNGVWKTASASINTWRDKSVYDNGLSTSLTNDGIWRKYQNYIWKDNLDADGTFGSELTESDFNWTENGSQTNAQWEKISETTRYNHWSSPLEIKDINSNYLATKMGDDNSKVFATGNGSYNELFYSGAEDWDNQTNTYGGHVGLGDATEESLLSNVHTGNKSLRLAANQTGYTVSVIQGKRDEYKVSLWAKYGAHQNVKIKVGSSTNYIDFNIEELIRAGNWVQLNYYFTISGQQAVSVINTGGTAYVDDFRLYPKASSMISYVYNDFDELTHIIGGNNMATEYKYDEAGRLFQTLTEVADFADPGSGGFNKVSENKYTYKY